jgi:MOSC domain-containing protein YiiM
MIDVDLPQDEAIPELTRSFAACMASMIAVPIADVPQPQTDLPEAMGHWRSWLAGRGMGLVALAKPANFKWPGYWLAVLGQPQPCTRADDIMAVLMFGTPSGVVLSPQDPYLLGRAASDLPIQEGYVICTLDPALIARASPLPHLRGTVMAIALADRANADMYTVEYAKALANKGLEGDRYATKAGTFSPPDDTAPGYDLTLIEAEVLDKLTLPRGRALGYAEARRNIVTHGIDLNSLVGRRFRVGDVECIGRRLCEPCSHLERLTTKGALRALIHRGGLRADVVSDGDITTGAIIETMD